MQALILFIHIAIAIALIALVLVQPGQGAHAGSAFGAGGSQSVFGSQGSSSFLAKLTTYLAIGFFATSIMLVSLNQNQNDRIFTEPSSASVPLVQEKATPAISSEAPQQSNSDVPVEQ